MSSFIDCRFLLILYYITTCARKVDIVDVVQMFDINKRFYLKFYFHFYLTISRLESLVLVPILIKDFILNYENYYFIIFISILLRELHYHLYR